MGLLNDTAKDYYSGSDFGGYQFVSLDNIINNFMIAYVGEGKIIPKVKRADVSFHAQRAIQELSYDTFKSTKSQEIELPPSLTMMLPQDYVNYVKLTWLDGAGVEHIMYPASKTSNPFSIKQASDGSYSFDADDDGTDDTTSLIENDESTTWSRYKSHTPAETNDDYEDDTFWPNMGQRYGLEPSHAQANGSFYIDELKGKIHFSSNISGKTVTLKYISDGLGTDEEMIVHKFAEEAMYKSIAYAILSTTINGQALAPTYQKQKSAAIRVAKIRLSNLKIEELTQIMRGKSKFIKH
tara:strand:- start:259 stop:1146 length:888 start_codon:yes stop_codon:yes gene_type:complete